MAFTIKLILDRLRLVAPEIQQRPNEPTPYEPGLADRLELEHGPDIGARPAKRREVEDAKIGITHHRNGGAVDQEINARVRAVWRDLVVERIETFEPVFGTKPLLLKLSKIALLSLAGILPGVRPDVAWNCRIRGLHPVFAETTRSFPA
jgi:hypothetical protein